MLVLILVLIYLSQINGMLLSFTFYNDSSCVDPISNGIHTYWPDECYGLNTTNSILFHIQNNIISYSISNKSCNNINFDHIIYMYNINSNINQPWTCFSTDYAMMRPYVQNSKYNYYTLQIISISAAIVDCTEEEQYIYYIVMLSFAIFVGVLIGVIVVVCVYNQIYKFYKRWYDKIVEDRKVKNDQRYIRLKNENKQFKIQITKLKDGILNISDK